MTTTPEIPEEGYPNCGHLMTHSTHDWFDDRGESARHCDGYTEPEQTAALRHLRVGDRILKRGAA
jgi:hypothetical protein